jgi:hypothetical protein
LAFGVFVLLPIRQYYDSLYTVLLAENLAREGSFRLDAFFGSPEQETPYQIKEADDHYYLYFPPGSAILSAPFLPIFNLFGYSSISNGEYDRGGDLRIQKRLAAFLCAFVCGLAYLTARLFLSRKPALLLIAGLAFGTPLVSTASRAMWSHTWPLLLAFTAIHLLLSARGGLSRIRAAAVASLLCWCFFSRPTYAFSVVVIGAYCWSRSGRVLTTYLATIMAWLGLFFGYSLFTFGTLVPSYFRSSRLKIDSVLAFLPEVLASPSRGLLIYFPVLLLVGWIVARRTELTREPLVWASGLLMAVHVAVVATFWHWWGGHGYGARLMTDLLPWLFVLVLFCLRDWQGPSTTRAAGQKRVWVLALLLSVALNLPAATSFRSSLWNWCPEDVDVRRERLLDWGDPQFLAWARSREDCRE